MSTLPAERAVAEDPAIKRVSLKVKPGTETIIARWRHPYPIFRFREHKIHSSSWSVP
jgi:hypothetical protein